MNWFSELIVSPVLAGREAPKASWLIGCFSLTRNRLSLSLGSGSSLSFSVLAFKSWRRARVGRGCLAGRGAACDDRSRGPCSPATDGSRPLSATDGEGGPDCKSLSLFSLKAP